MRAGRRTGHSNMIHIISSMWALVIVFRIACMVYDGMQTKICTTEQNHERARCTRLGIDARVNSRDYLYVTRYIEAPSFSVSKPNE